MYLEKYKIDVVLAFSERSTAVLCENKNKLNQLTSVPYGSFSDFNTLNDKYTVLKVCKKVKVPTPKFIGVEKIEDLPNVEKLGFPIVLKCCLASGVKEAFRICRSTNELRKGYIELTSRESSYSYFKCDRLVAEGFVEGPIFDCGFAVNKGEVISAVAQERLWTIPPEGGFGAYNITRDIPELVEYGRKIFREISWTGPAQLEFIFDQKDKAYKLIEINPRFWGTLGLSIKAGVNIAEDVIQIGLRNMNLEERISASAGVTFEWLLQETLTAEKMRGSKGNLIFSHIKRIFGREVNNFSYSIGANILLSIPHLAAYFSCPNKPHSSSISLAKKLFE
ncbi:MAG TPA: ATP-grasp domain-containing protein [Pelolinea sp.]|nr:ATP-grasp domain-containing protein [Pelolinea sp.]